MSFAFYGRRSQCVPPAGNRFSNMFLLSVIHVICALNLGGIHAAWTSRQMFDRGLDLIQVLLVSNVSICPQNDE